jgi:hypothetical protein
MKPPARYDVEFEAMGGVLGFLTDSHVVRWSAF